MRKGLKEYWKRRGYQRLNGSGWRRRNKNWVVELGTTRNRRRWRINMAPKIKIRIPTIPSPKKLLLRLRDAYERMMLGLANSRVTGMGVSAIGYRGDATSIAMPPPPKEYDEKMIIHIYKSLMMARGQSPVHAPAMQQHPEWPQKSPAVKEW